MPRLLELLGCPYDRSALAQDFLEGGEGGLSCPACRRGFPVIRGVPRMLPDELLSELLRAEASFFVRHRDWWTGKANASVGAAPEAEAARRTLRSFGYQWTRFVDRPGKVWEQDLDAYLYPLGPEDFAGRLVLDAGCGNGRFLKVALDRGAEVVGLDLSAAVDSAAMLAGGHPRAHVVQGSLLRPPFRASFDLIYSIGVLHHLPEGTESGVRSLSGLLKPGGSLAIWVYSTRRVEETRLRAWAARLPLPMLRAASFFLAAGIWCRDILPRRLCRSQAPPKGWSGYRDYGFHILWTDLFDMLAPPVERQHDAPEIEGWFKTCGLSTVHLSHVDAFQGWRGLGRKEGA